MMGLASLLEDVLRLKGFTKPKNPLKVDCSRAADHLGVRKDELYRYLYKGRNPEDEAKRKIIDRLELDANFVLGTAMGRYTGKTLRVSLSHMALDRYLQTHDVTERHKVMLSAVAEEHADPPLWSTAWAQLHVALDIALPLGIGQAPSEPKSSRPRRYTARPTRSTTVRVR